MEISGAPERVREILEYHLLFGGRPNCISYQQISPLVLFSD
jgi:hypothetical protein